MKFIDTGFLFVQDAEKINPQILSSDNSVILRKRFKRFRQLKPLKPTTFFTVKLDRLDLQIIDELTKNATQPFTELAKKLFVSGGTIHVRMRKLHEMGIVKGSGLHVDYEALGYDISAFLGIYLDKSSLYDDVSGALMNIPEIVSAHYTTGQYSIFAKIVCRDTNHLRDVLHDKIQKIQGIQRTETFISLQESINRPVDILNDADNKK